MTVESLLPLVLPLVLGGGLIAYLKYRPERDLGFAQTAKLLNETSESLVVRWERENADLRDRVARMELNVEACARENRALRVRIEKLEANGTP